MVFNKAILNSTFTNSMFRNFTNNGTLPLSPQLNENSWASVFSTFLALAFCIITQPYGSIIFSRQGGWSWRLSPCSALLEALLIFVGLIFCRSRHDDIQLPVSALDPDDENSDSSQQSLGPTTTSLRQDPVVANEQHTQPRSGLNMASNEVRHVQPIRTSSMDTVPTIIGIPTRLPARVSTLPSFSSAANYTAAAVIARSMTFTEGMRMPASNPLDHNASASWKQPTRESVVSTLSKVWQSIISFRPSHLRHGWRPTAALLLLFRSGNFTGDFKFDRQTIVDELGTYLGHRTKGRRIQYWTTISAFFLLIKLCAVRGAPIFTFIGIIYVVSWSSVEILLVLLQQDGLSEDQVDALLDSRHAAAKLENLQFWGATVWISTSFCTFFGIFTFSVFKTSTGFNILTWISILATTFVPIFALANIIPVARKKNHLCTNLCAILMSLLVTIAWPYYILFATIEVMESEASVRNSWGVFAIATLLFWVFRFVTLCFAALVLLAACMYASSMKENNKMQSMIGRRIINALLCLLTVGAYLHYYTPDGTYKPSFLEIIGM
ncbi:hypothetical protein JMJ35_004553 [Cladonia borealis]|uniref:Uncharacterized protein n=1 Tax=Cladonia borealis TaxID=184061 RepID=A0AA39R1X4_9LECA|nr:hypothetical protein JMJ35_004553 [Cladonia borealis]